MLSRMRVECEECDELRAQVAKEQAPPGTCETIPPTQSDSQPDEMYLSTVEEESGDESMLMGGSTGAEDDLDVGRDNGIWERRRNAIIKNKRMVILGNSMQKSLPGFLRMKLGVVLSHLSSSTVQSWGQSIGSQQYLEVSSGVSIAKCGLRLFPGSFNNFEKRSCPQFFGCEQQLHS